MKKIFSFATCICSLCLSFLIVGCQNNLSNNYENLITYDNSIVEFVKESNPILADGLEYSDIGMTVDGFTNLLKNKLSKNLVSRGNNLEAYFDTEFVLNTIDEKVTLLNVPDFENLTDDDMNKIRKDFPSLNDDEIEENLDMIFIVYQEQVGVLSLKSILNVDNDNNNLVSRSGIYDDYQSHKDKLTPEMTGAMLKHACSALTLRKARDLAVAFTDQYMGNMYPGDTIKDAFRHAILNVTLATEGCGSQRARLAWACDLMTAYEQGSQYVPKTSEMDLHNNFIGRNVYAALTNKKIKKADYSRACKIIKDKTDVAIFVDIDLDNETVIKEINKVPCDTFVYLRK